MVGSPYAESLLVQIRGQDALARRSIPATNLGVGQETDRRRTPHHGHTEGLSLAEVEMRGEAGAGAGPASGVGLSQIVRMCRVTMRQRPDLRCCSELLVVVEKGHVKLES